MKTKTLISFLIIGAAFVAALAYRLTSVKQPVIEPAPSGADALRIDDANYARVVGAAQARVHFVSVPETDCRYGEAS